jgi:hypothetical protein
MADIKNYTLNFVSGRRAERGLTCAARKLACNEIQLLDFCASLSAFVGRW